MAAYDLLVELATCCYDNLSLIAEQLITMHHQPDPQIAKEWEVRVGRGEGRGEEVQGYANFNFIARSSKELWVLMILASHSNVCSSISVHGFWPKSENFEFDKK